LIHHELGRAFVAGADGPEGVELATPRDALVESEAGLTADDVGEARIEAVRALHAWVMEAGPHPRAVADRLVLASADYAFALVRGMSPLDLAAATAPNADLRERALMRVLLDAPKANAGAVRKHAARIALVLGVAYRRQSSVGQASAAGAVARPLSALQGADEDEGAAGCAVRREACRRWLGPVWADGRLGEALKAFYAITRSYWPGLVLNMSGEQMAAFFGQTRAAESERVHRLVNRPIERASGRRMTLRFQKSATACAKYAAGARGNTHRADSVERKAA
jgi:hypothetical protein